MIKEKAYIATVVKIFTLGAILVRSMKRSGKIFMGNNRQRILAWDGTRKSFVQSVML